MKKRHSFSLIEIIIVMVLMGMLFSGLFSAFYQTLKKNAENRELKQELLSVELFDQQIKQLLTRTKKIWSTEHAEATGLALCFQFTPEIDVEWDRNTDTLGMLYLNKERRLCFSSWPSNSKARVDLFLDKIDSLSLHFFDSKQKAWAEQWSEKIETLPPMITVLLTWKGKEMPFTFFPPNADEQISYSGVP